MVTARAMMRLRWNLALCDSLQCFRIRPVRYQYGLMLVRSQSRYDREKGMAHKRGCSGISA